MNQNFDIRYDSDNQRIYTYITGDGNGITQVRIVIRDIDSRVVMWRYVTGFHGSWCVPIPKDAWDYEKDPNIGGFFVEVFDNETNDLLFTQNIRLKYPPIYKPKLPLSEEPAYINYTEFFIKKLYDGLAISSPKVVLDIGANIGMWTEWVLQQNAHQVYAFEPNKVALKDLHKLHGNNDRVTIIDKALYFENTELTFYTSKDNSLVSALAPHDGRGFVGRNLPEASYKVDTTTLETFIKEYDIKHIDLVKIDIEGGEFDIIPTLHQSTFDIIDAFLMEIHWRFFEDGEKKFQQLKDIMYQQGYNIKQFKDDSVYFSKFKDDYIPFIT